MKYFVTLLLCLFSVSIFAQIKLENKNEVKIKELLKKMTLEEKVGQMTQITLSVFSNRKNEQSELVLNLNKLREGIVKYHIGSILNTGGAANSLKKWIEIITTIQNIALKETRLKIPILYGIDAIHGANYLKEATIFPQAIALAASRNKELVRKVAEITGYETKGSGIPWNFNPVLGIGKQPLWSRFFETYGEDVYLTSELGSDYIKGLEDNQIDPKASILACMKHYMGYSFPLNGKDRTPAWIPERQLREIFLPPFTKAVKSGALTVMVNSSEINGIPTHSNYHVLTEILKGELKFKGFVVSDWEDIKRLYDRDRVADSPKDAVRMAVMAGVDMSMVPKDYSFYKYLLELVKEDKVPMSRINDAVTRILRAKFASGIFANPYPDKSLTNRVGSSEFDNVNLQVAEESIVLLKNENEVLPLEKGSKILVTGPTSNLRSVLNGGWTYTWQGNNENLYPKEKETILEAIQNKFGKNNVDYGEGINFDKDINSGEIVKKAKESDAIILCLGEPTYCETPGNIDNLKLAELQLNFANKLAETGKPIILILTEGRPRVFHRIAEKMSGIVLTMLPGMEGGKALGNILSGDYNPNGKLPFTYPNSVNGFTTYDYKPLENFDNNKFDCEYPFGFGLSYTTFSYSNMKLSKNEIKANESLTISVDVKNTGSREGKISVELYITDLYGSVSRPNKQLKGFKKISLEPNETKTVEFNLPSSELSFIGRKNKRILEPGKFEVKIDKLTNEFSLK